MARKILLADDSVTAQNMGRKILADAGYDVIAVNNGSAALKKIAELKPDLAILDVYMPGYSGIEVCQRLKESPETARIPVLLSVGKLEPFKPEEAQRVRAEGYIVKPFEASELLSALAKLEDKIVPRVEPSKPGRFAKAMAVAEETSRGNKGEAPKDEGAWKSRIGFPQEKDKTAPEEKFSDDAAIYNPMNRDLRTVVETPAEKIAEKVAQSAEKQPAEKQPEKQGHDRPVAAPESTVDVAAVAPEGFPREVTPEEIAAIAAAAAQIQMASAILPPEDMPVSAGGRLQENSQPSVNLEAGQTQGEPVTMAATADSLPAVDSGTPRWTAVAVALEGDESAVSLEQEMQKAYAASSVTDPVTALAPEAQPQPAVAESHLPASERVEETPVAATANFDIDSVSSSAPVAIEAGKLASDAAAANAIPPELGAAVSSSIPVESIAAESSSSAEPVSVTLDQAVAVAEPLAIPASLAQEVPPVEAASEAAPVTAEASLPEPAQAAELPNFVPESELPQPQIPQPEITHPEIAQAEIAQPEIVASADLASDDSSEQYSIVADPVKAQEISATNNSFAPIAREPEAAPESNPHTDAVKTTAAAWASWRQIRDTSKPSEVVATESKPVEEVKTPETAPELAPPETTAMAVAAGAEQSPQEVLVAPANGNSADTPSDVDNDVASIVESVLADLRPKLMQEISRKMAQKK
ncbi:MAG: response regulator [Candidatus Sulfotelmatobacter sp.]